MGIAVSRSSSMLESKHPITSTDVHITSHVESKDEAEPAESGKSAEASPKPDGKAR